MASAKQSLKQPLQNSLRTESSASRSLSIHNTKRSTRIVASTYSRQASLTMITGRGVLRTVALFALVAGAGGTEALMLHVGNRNPSYLLLGLFTIWDLSPFAALALAYMISKCW